jgi:protein SCO1/2
MSPTFKWLLPLAGMIALAFGIWLGKEQFSPAAKAPVIALKSATELRPPRPLQPFQLIASEARAFTLDNLRGQWNFLAIGYTHCPDVCPTTLATFDAVAKQLKNQKIPARFIFISVDPERDSAEKLTEYVRYFNPTFIGATGRHEELQGFTRQLGILYAKAPVTDSALGYLVDHSASILLVDPEARLSAIFSAPHDAFAMAEDFISITTQRNQ